jgi:hypothetical protein
MYGTGYKRLGTSFPKVDVTVTFPTSGAGSSSWRFPAMMIVAPVLASTDDDGEEQVRVTAGTASQVQPLHFQSVTKLTSLAGELNIQPGVMLVQQYDASNDAHMTKVKVLCRHIVKHPEPPCSVLLPVPSVTDELALRKAREAAHAMNSAWEELDQASAGLARPSFVLAIDQATEELLNMLVQVAAEMDGSAAAAAAAAASSASSVSSLPVASPLALSVSSGGSAPMVAHVPLFPDIAYMGILDSFNALNGTARLLTRINTGDALSRTAAFNTAWWLINGRTMHYELNSFSPQGGTQEVRISVPGSESIKIRAKNLASFNAPPGCTLTVASAKTKVLTNVGADDALCNDPIEVRGSQAVLIFTWPAFAPSNGDEKAYQVALTGTGFASSSPPGPVRQRLIQAALANQLGSAAALSPIAALDSQLQAFLALDFSSEATGGLHIDERLLPLSDRCLSGGGWFLSPEDELTILRLSQAIDMPFGALCLRTALLRVFSDTHGKLSSATRGGAPAASPFGSRANTDFQSGAQFSVNPLSLVRGVPLQRLKRLLGGKDSVNRLMRALDLSSSRSGGASLSLSLLSSLQDAERALSGGTAYDIATSTCIFAQTWRSVRKFGGSLYRTKGKIFGVAYQDESGIDAGGVFRETLSRLVDDLCGSHFPLFVPTPKHRDRQVHEYMPNPALTSPTAISMFEFVGQLLGYALRSQAALPFAFPSLVWQALVGDPADFEDLLALDPSTANLIHSLLYPERTADAEGNAREPLLGPSDFDAAFQGLTFAAIGANGQVIELLPGGKETSVTWDNRTMYAELLLDRRLHECSLQLAAIRRGFGTVVPLSLVSLLQWHDVEKLVCGDPKIELEYLRRHTMYGGGYALDHPVIRRFWRAFAQLSYEERSGLIRFAWGRSRLPTEDQWGTSSQNGFTIVPAHRVTIPAGFESKPDADWPTGEFDGHLPVGHTCFFSIDLPPYSSDAIMLKQLRIAILYGSKSLGQA